MYLIINHYLRHVQTDDDFNVRNVKKNVFIPVFDILIVSV